MLKGKIDSLQLSESIEDGHIERPQPRWEADPKAAGEEHLAETLESAQALESRCRRQHWPEV